MRQGVEDRAGLRHAGSAALVVAILVLLMAASAEALASPAPDAVALDAFLARHASPMTGAGATFIREGLRHGVNPVFLVAIAGAESSFGRFLYSRNGDQCTYNAFNWFYGPTRPESDFASWDEGIARVAAGLSGGLYHGAGLYSVDAIAPRYCPEGTAEWIANVKAFMGMLGVDWSDTRVAPVTGPVPDDAQVENEPGLVELDGSVKLDDGDREVGQRIYACWS